MKRKIKFRVWDSMLRKFVLCNVDIFNNDNVASNIIIFNAHGQAGLMLKSGDFYPLPENRFTVQQSTEREDFNGKEIYEGDIGYMNYIGTSPEWEKAHNLFEIIFLRGAFQIKPIKLFRPKRHGEGGGNLFFSYIVEISGFNKRSGDAIFKYRLPPPKPISETNIFEVIGNIFENPELLKINV